MVSSFNPSPISASALALTRRQLADWQQFHADLTLRNAPADEIDYAEAYIERLNAEISSLQAIDDLRNQGSPALIDSPNQII